MSNRGKEPLALEKEPEGWGQGTGFELQLEVACLVALKEVTNLSHSDSSFTKLR